MAALPAQRTHFPFSLSLTTRGRACMAVNGLPAPSDRVGRPPRLTPTLFHPSLGIAFEENN
jgi:hypothetical protein